MHDDDSLKTMVLQLRERYEHRVIRGKPLRFMMKPGAGDNRVGEFVIFDRFVAIVSYLSSTDTRTYFQRFCSLTHELGHWCSWRDETRSLKYEASIKAGVAAMATLPEASRLLIFEEEVRAWTNGYRLAQEVGFLDAQAYDVEASRALRFYRELLSVPEKMRPVATVCTLFASARS
jgi:hypothetical protein